MKMVMDIMVIAAAILLTYGTIALIAQAIYRSIINPKIKNR